MYAQGAAPSSNQSHLDILICEFFISPAVMWIRINYDLRMQQQKRANSLFAVVAVAAVWILLVVVAPSRHI